MTELARIAPAAAAAPPAALISETTDRTFAKDVLEASKAVPVLVDFWAEWCGPCRQLTPILEAQVKAAKGTVRLVKMNIDHHPAIANQLGIQSIPAVIAFKDGRPVDWFQGAQPESKVKAFIAKVAGPGGAEPGLDDLLAAAAGALADGALAEAGEMYAAVLDSQPEHIGALVGLAEVALAEGDLDRAEAVLSLVPPAKAKDAAVVALRAKLALARQTAALGNGGDLEARIAKNPADLDARFDLALLRHGKGDRAGATDLLLDIMRRDRSWNEDKARKQLVQFFEAWGPKDEATLAGRRRLSSLLFS